MKPIADFETAKKEAESMGNSIPKLPVGAYVLKVQNVRYDSGVEGRSDKIVLMYDIEEGEQKGYFKKRFEATTDENKKWKGVFTIYVPKEDGSDSEYAKKNFARVINHFEASNKGFNWAWNEQELKGKYIGGVFGEVQKVIEGTERCWVEMRWTDTVENVKEGKCNIPDKKVFPGATSSSIPSPSDNFMDMNNLPQGIVDVPF